MKNLNFFGTSKDVLPIKSIEEAVLNKIEMTAEEVRKKYKSLQSPQQKLGFLTSMCENHNRIANYFDTLDEKMQNTFLAKLYSKILKQAGLMDIRKEIVDIGQQTAKDIFIIK